MNLHAVSVEVKGEKMTINLSFRDNEWRTFFSALELSEYKGDTPHQFAASLCALADLLLADFKNSQS